MKKIFLLAVSGMLFLACGGGEQPITLHGTWSLLKVEDVKTGALAADQVYKGTVYTFREDGTANFSQSGEFGNKNFEGTWTRADDLVTIVQDGRTSEVKIDSMSAQQLFWLAPASAPQWKLSFERMEGKK